MALKKILILSFLLMLMPACQSASYSTPQQAFVENALGFDIICAQVEGCTLGSATVQKNGIQFVNDRGRPLPYEEMTEVNGAGAIVVRNGDKYGMVNKHFELVVPVVYDSILQVRGWNVDSLDNYVTPAIFYLFQGDSIYSLDWKKGILATFSQSVDNPQYLYEDFSVVIAQGELPFASYSGELDYAIEWLMPGLKNSEFTIYASSGDVLATAMAQPIPDGYQDGLTFEFGVEVEQYIATLGEVDSLALQSVNAEQIPVGTLTEQANFIEGFCMPDGRFVVSYSVQSEGEVLCELVLVDGDNITLLHGYKNGTTGPPVDPKVLLYAQMGNEKYIYFAKPTMQGNTCIEIEL